MMPPSPSSLVQYQTSGSFLPPWPAVVCTDDMASEEAAHTRPHEYVTLLLLMGKSLDFRWARTTEMSDFDPFAPFTHKESISNTPGLADAYEMANNTLDMGLDLDYWREQLTDPVNDASGSGSDEADSDEEGYSDPELRRALRLSREDFCSKRLGERVARRTASLPTPCLSPLTPTRCSGNHQVAVATPANGASGPFTQAWTAPLSAVASSSSFPDHDGKSHTPLSSQDRLHVHRSDMPIDLTNEGTSSHSAGKRPIGPTPFKLFSFIDEALGGLDRGSQKPTSDTVDGELSESKEFVQVLVGPDEEVSTLQKQCVWNRPYFRDPRYGVNHFDHNDNGIWELRHPALAEILPGDFVFVAEYLESEGFGHRHPQEGEEMEEALVQCVSAWITAEKLGMSDLMDHVVDKLERDIKPEMQAMLLFACQVYGSEDTALPSQGRLKEYLAMYIAENWWIYLSDDHLNSGFIEQLQRLPELERDVYWRRLPALEERIGGNERDDDTEMG